MAITYVGIDFGTTKTTVCKFVEGSKQPLTIPMQNGKSEISTAIAMDNDSGKVVGWGDEVENNQYSNAKVYYNFKLFAGRKNNENTLHKCHDGSTRDIIEEYFRQIFTTLKNGVFNGGDLGAPDYQFIVGCPTEWKKDQRNHFIEMIRGVGFRHVELLDEPCAIAEYHEWNQDVNFGDDPFLVVDFGGSTLNMGAFIPHKSGFVAIASKGKTKGGRDFDFAIAKTLTEKYEEFGRRREKNELGSIRHCNLLKIKFSNKMNQGEDSPTLHHWAGTDLLLEKKEFENQCSGLINLVPTTVSELLNESNLDPNKITKIVTSGGSSQFYFVRPELKKMFPHLGDS